MDFGENRPKLSEIAHYTSGSQKERKRRKKAFRPTAASDRTVHATQDEAKKHNLVISEARTGR